MKKIKSKTTYDIDAVTKSEWLKFENNVAWEFDYFFDKIVRAYQSSRNQVYALNLNNDVSEFGFVSSEGSDPIMPAGLFSGPISTMPSSFKKDPEWIKRNSYFYTKVETGGYSGGSCWDDDRNYARWYETGNTSSPEDLIKIVEMILSEMFGSRSSGLCEGMPTREDSTSDYEYYGNSTNYECQFITLWDLYKFLHKKDIY